MFWVKIHSRNYKFLNYLAPAKIRFRCEFKLELDLDARVK